MNKLKHTLDQIEKDLIHVVNTVLDENNEFDFYFYYILGRLKTNFDLLKDLLDSEPPKTSLEWMKKLTTELDKYTSKFLVITYAITNKLITKKTHPSFFDKVTKIVEFDSGKPFLDSEVYLFNYIQDTDNNYFDDDDGEILSDYPCSNQLNTLIDEYFTQACLQEYLSVLTN